MVVKDVVPGFAADACGNIKPGDVLVSIDGRPLSRLSLEQVKGLMLGIPGSRAVLEVRSREVPFILEHGQIVGRLVYERMMARPDKLYGQGISSNYQGQSLKLSKHFKPA